MKKFTKILAVLLLAVSAFCLASCGGDKKPDDPVSGDVITIEYWHGNGAELEAVLREIADDFEKKYEGKYKVNLTKFGGYDNLRDTIAAGISAGDTPTAAQTYPDHVALYLYGEALQSLDKYINDPQYGMSASEQAQFIPGFWAEGTIYDDAGTRYALPFNKSTEVLHYNKTLFEKEGWAVPTTWDEVIDICEAWKGTESYANAVAANGQDAVYGLGYDSVSNLFITLTQQWGAKYTSFDANGQGLYNAFGANATDTALSQTALQWFVNQHDAGNLATPTDFGNAGGYCSTAFLNGQCIMTVGSSAGSSKNDGAQATVAKFETGVAPIPQKDLNNKQVIQQGTNVSLFKCDSSEEELGGWLWLKYMVSYEAALKWATRTSYFAIRQDVIDSQEYQDILNGITREGDIVIQGAVTMMGKAKAVGAAQADSYFTNIAFPGSSKARDEAATLVDIILYSDPVVAVQQAYQDAYNSIKNN